MTQRRTSSQWQELYGSIEHAFYIPERPAGDTAKDVVIQSMVVDMGQVARDLKERQGEWQTLTILADVIVFPSPRAQPESILSLSDNSSSLTLCAREIQTAPDIQALILTNVPDAVFKLYAHEISGHGLSFDQTPLDGENYRWPLTIVPELAGMTIAGYGLAPAPLTALPDGWGEQGSPFYWQMESAYNCAAALQGKEPALAQSILAWIHKIAGGSPQLYALQQNAAQLLIQLQQFNAKIDYVPVLSQSAYHEATEEYISAAESFEKAFDSFSAALTTQKGAGQYAKAMMGLFEDKTSASDQLVAQVERNLSDAQTGLRANMKRLNDYRDKDLSDAIKVFNAGVNAFKEAEHDRLILGAITAVFTVVTSVAEMAAGDEAAVGTAVEGVAKTATGLEKLAEMIKKIAKMIKELTELLKTIEEAQEAVKKLLESKELQGENPSIKIPSADTTYDNTYWDAFSINAKSVLTQYTTGATKIEGANDYLKCLLTLAVYGKGAYASQLAVVKYQQKKLQLKLDQLSNRNMEARLQKVVKSGDQDQAGLQEAKLMFYRKLVDVKGRVIILINEEIAAYKYWAVTTTLPVAPPALSDKVGDLYATLGRITEGRLNALKSMYPGPQKMHPSVSIDKNSHPDAFEQFKRNKRMTFTIPLTDHHFEGLGRLRITDLDVFLNDEAVADPQAEVRLMVETNGHYYDRDSETIEFSTVPLHAPFRYKPDDKANPVVDIQSPDPFAEVYFHPTPLTTWTLSVDPSNEASLRLDQLTSITFHFNGNAIGLPS